MLAEVLFVSFHPTKEDSTSPIEQPSCLLCFLPENLGGRILRPNDPSVRGIPFAVHSDRRMVFGGPLTSDMMTKPVKGTSAYKSRKGQGQFVHQKHKHDKSTSRCKDDER